MKFMDDSLLNALRLAKTGTKSAGQAQAGNADKKSSDFQRAFADIERRKQADTPIANRKIADEVSGRSALGSPSVRNAANLDVQQRPAATQQQATPPATNAAPLANRRIADERSDRATSGSQSTRDTHASQQTKASSSNAIPLANRAISDEMSGRTTSISDTAQSQSEPEISSRVTDAQQEKTSPSNMPSRQSEQAPIANRNIADENMGGAPADMLSAGDDPLDGELKTALAELSGGTDDLQGELDGFSGEVTETTARSDDNLASTPTEVEPQAGDSEDVDVKQPSENRSQERGSRAAGEASGKGDTHFILASLATTFGKGRNAETAPGAQPVQSAATSVRSRQDNQDTRADKDMKQMLPPRLPLSMPVTSIAATEQAAPQAGEQNFATTLLAQPVSSSVAQTAEPAPVPTAQKAPEKTVARQNERFAEHTVHVTLQNRTAAAEEVASDDVPASSSMPHKGTDNAQTGEKASAMTTAAASGPTEDVSQLLTLLGSRQADVAAASGQPQLRAVEMTDAASEFQDLADRAGATTSTVRGTDGVRLERGVAASGQAATGPATAATDRDQTFRFARADGKGQAISMSIAADGDRLAVRNDQQAAQGAAAKVETVTVLEARRYLGLAPASNAAAITTQIAADSGWSRAMQPAATAATAAAQHTTGKVLNTLKIQMTPIDLGTVTATLRLKDNELHVELKVETGEAFRQLSDDQTDMVKALRAQGFAVDQVNVVFNAADTSSSNAAAQQPQAGQQGRDIAGDGSGQNRGHSGNGQEQDRGRWAGNDGNGEASAGFDHLQSGDVYI